MCQIPSLTYFRYFQDYEYASFNPIAYDIANHFCEMAADYHTDTPHILDFSKYPGWLFGVSEWFPLSKFCFIKVLFAVSLIFLVVIVHLIPFVRC